MKKIQLILFTLMMASLVVVSVSLAQPSVDGTGGQGPGPAMNQDFGATGGQPARPEPQGPLGQLVKFEHENITVAVLADLTGQDADTIAAELELRHPSEILADYDIDMETFVAAMDAQVTALVKAEVAAGTITSDQGDEIIDMIQNKPERPAPPTDGDVPPRFEYSE